MPSLPYHAAPYHRQCKKAQLKSRILLLPRTRISVRSVFFLFSLFFMATPPAALSATKASSTTPARGWRFYSSPWFPSFGAFPFRSHLLSSTVFFPYKAVFIVGVAPLS